MTETAGQRLKAAGAVAAIVVAALAIAAALGLVLPWQAVSRAEHEKATTENAREHTLIKADIGQTARAVEGVGGDVKIIKCLMLAPNTKAKAKCGLSP